MRRVSVDDVFTKQAEYVIMDFARESVPIHTRVRSNGVNNCLGIFRLLLARLIMAEENNRPRR